MADSGGVAVAGHEMPEAQPVELGTVEEVSFITTDIRRTSRRCKIIDEDEPLVDTTEALSLRSKKTERVQKRLHKKQQRAATRTAPVSLLDLPPELLEEIFGNLPPSSIYDLLLTSHGIYNFIKERENSIIREIIRRRYWVLSRCFVLPVSFSDVDCSAHPALLSTKRQNMLTIHKKPYSHVKGIDHLKICTCMACVFAWNNLCLILDLAHWQPNLNNREPIPMIPRGSTPEWNKTLLDRNAAIVEQAMHSPLTYARCLQTHLETTTSTILRTFKTKNPPSTVPTQRLYHLTHDEARKGTDAFLDRSGPPSYEFPWHRDNYYALEAYVPNRKWSRERGRWIYYAEGLHEKDLQWVKDRFAPGSGDAVPSEGMVAKFREQARDQRTASWPGKGAG